MADPLVQFVHRAWRLPGGSTDNWFPGPQPISIERRHFPLLKKSDYLVCEKTDGVRHLLVAFGVDKKVALVNRSFSATYYNKYTLPRDTLLDGELVTRTSDQKLIFLVHDAVMIRGESLIDLSLNERLDRARALCRTILSKAPFMTVVKTMYPLAEIRSLEGPSQFMTDGLIFTPISEPIRTGTHETMFKWKPREHITIDFLIKDRVDLYIQERGRLIREAVLDEKKGIYPDGTIIECEHGLNGWQVVKVRTDKTYPNNRRTFLRTIVNLREDIQLKEFWGILDNGEACRRRD